MGGFSWDVDYVLFQPVQPRSAGVSAKVSSIVTSRKNPKVSLNYYLFRASFDYFNSLNFRAPFIFAHLVCTKIKGARKRPIFAHFDARKLMGARNSQISFMSRKIFFKGSDIILRMCKGSFLIREAYQAEHKEKENKKARSRKQYQ